MEQDQHPLNVGKLVVNLQSLEFALRAFLYEITKRTRQNASSYEELKLDKLKEGDIVEGNAFTNYDDLRTLIIKYNNNPKISSAGFTINETIVDIRDAIAHGRVFGITPKPPMTLLKFSKPFGEPPNKQVEVKFSVLLTREWFNEQLPKVQSAALVVAKALDMLQKGKL
jgi:hypothetical protein